MNEGVYMKRCGFIKKSGMAAREQVELYNKAGDKVGFVTSGSPSPILKCSVGMAYVKVPDNKANTKLFAKIKDNLEEVTVSKVPFVPTKYYKKP